VPLLDPTGMDILLLRHAIAEDREQWADAGFPDSRRPLTTRGREKMKLGARGLALIAGPVDLVATSPYERAKGTARLVAKALGHPRVVSIEALSAGRPALDTLRWLAGRREKRVLLVGHEPDLGRLAALLVHGEASPPLAMKKGGACLLHTPRRPSPGSAELRWFLTPALLRRMAS